MKLTETTVKIITSKYREIESFGVNMIYKYSYYYELASFFLGS